MLLIGIGIDVFLPDQTRNKKQRCGCPMVNMPDGGFNTNGESWREQPPHGIASGSGVAAFINQSRWGFVKFGNNSGGTELHNFVFLNLNFSIIRSGAKLLSLYECSMVKLTAGSGLRMEVCRVLSMSA